MNRDQNGKFAKSGMLKWFILSVVIAGGMVGTAIWYQHKYPIIETKTVTIDNSGDMFAQKVDSLEKSVVEAVRACESTGHKESDGLIIFDSNKVASIGTLQWQVKSVIY